LESIPPLFRLLYDFVPGFDKFRSVSKFIFRRRSFLVSSQRLALDRLLRQKKWKTTFVVAAFLLAASLSIISWWTSQTNSWRALMDAVHAMGESHLPSEFYATAN